MISEHTHIVLVSTCFFFFFFSSRRRHTRCSRDWSSDVCSSDLAWRWRWISAPCGDRTQCLERLVSRGKPRVGGCLEQRFTQLVDGPPEVQGAAQVRLELLGVSGGGEHRDHHQAAVLQLETGPVPDATPDVLDGGLEERPQKRIASAGCRRLAGRCTEHLLTDLWAARPCVLCRGVHRSFSFHWTDHWRTEHWTERSKHKLTVLDCQVQIGYHSGHGERARTRNGEGARDARTDPPSRSRAPRREGRRRYELGRRPGTHRRQPQPALPLLR